MCSPFTERLHSLTLSLGRTNVITNGYFCTTHIDDRQFTHCSPCANANTPSSYFSLIPSSSMMRLVEIEQVVSRMQCEWGDCAEKCDDLGGHLYYRNGGLQNNN